MVNKISKITYIDLFAGIGGFRIAFTEAAEDLGLSSKCVFSSEIDEICRESYRTNFSDEPEGDITKIHEKDIPDHEVLLAGFPCQPFSIIGDGRGFRDKVRGTLFFDIARILDKKRPDVFVLENVKRLVGHNGGKTIKTILETLEGFGYTVFYKVFNALDFGLPQKRERVFIVGFQKYVNFRWPQVNKIMTPLTEILEPDGQIPKSYFASDYIRGKRHSSHKSKHYPSIWHENKCGNISSYPYSCALRANASYNYLLVNGERRLTPREMLRLQGFPETFKIVSTDSKTRTQAGNSLPIPVAKEVIKKVILNLINTDSSKNEENHIMKAFSKSRANRTQMFLWKN